MPFSFEGHFFVMPITYKLKTFPFPAKNLIIKPLIQKLIHVLEA
jgi:hypothetical protein